MAHRPVMLLTGASRGIGHATVKRFQAEGWRILTVSRQPFSEECRWPNARESHLQANLDDPRDVERLIEEVKRRLPEGKLHALVNNAGISPKLPDGGRMGVRDTTPETWLSVFNVNLFAIAELGRSLFQELKAAQGTIVNVTSIVGSRVHPFAGPAYACSKAALAALTREMAHEFGAHGVRVNAIAPGEIATAMLSPGTDAIIDQQIPMRRLGLPAEVGETILFLCSPQSSYINGAEIHINGGQHV
ncbi:dehydrogenase [Ameyamaea chiangmaiensis NBRC 103196]|uniref:SDR family oxidoreductase n=2 Tax=Ameyamaea chiangmaiensis TaxID=442969 RepID=A0A850PED6_9PROT|nr:SDR family oxidoreductase [Ameyamaea chiangmaiensis]NVN40626.1 SDR family oxidoreductase [Ameyamaea chiangmaiensis]GBQ68206.1 dehydrogenase [Ameyamaea chiangmaiensis NBRC 103196]